MVRGEGTWRNTVRPGSRVESPLAVGDSALIRMPICSVVSFTLSALRMLGECAEKTAAIHTWVGCVPGEAKEENRQERGWNVKYGSHGGENLKEWDVCQ